MGFSLAGPFLSKGLSYQRALLPEGSPACETTLTECVARLLYPSATRSGGTAVGPFCILRRRWSYRAVVVNPVVVGLSFRSRQSCCRRVCHGVLVERIASSFAVPLRGFWPITRLLRLGMCFRIIALRTIGQYMPRGMAKSRSAVMATGSMSAWRALENDFMAK